MLRLKKLSLSVIILLTVLSSMAQPVRVAVAANAQFVLQKLASDFKTKTGITVEVISGASGKLAAQIKQGAPYDIFLSADMNFAQNVFNDGLALYQPKIYALGSLVVCSATGADLKHWKSYVTNHTPGKIAIGNPDVAPYGKAAKEALNHYGLYEAASDRLVFGESISQVNTYILKGVVNIGFTTASLVYELNPIGSFKWEKVDPAAYSPIEQGAVLLKYAKNKNFVNNKKFFDYLFSPDAKAIFRQFGYVII